MKRCRMTAVAPGDSPAPPVARQAPTRYERPGERSAPSKCLPRLGNAPASMRPSDGTFVRRLAWLRALRLRSKSQQRTREANITACPAAAARVSVRRVWFQLRQGHLGRRNNPTDACLICWGEHKRRPWRCKNLRARSPRWRYWPRHKYRLRGRQRASNLGRHAPVVRSLQGGWLRTAMS
jgi:hypothetical protein